MVFILQQLLFLFLVLIHLDLIFRDFTVLLLKYAIHWFLLLPCAPIIFLLLLIYIFMHHSLQLLLLIQWWLISVKVLKIYLFLIVAMRLVLVIVLIYFIDLWLALVLNILVYGLQTTIWIWLNVFNVNVSVVFCWLNSYIYFSYVFHWIDLRQSSLYLSFYVYIIITIYYEVPNFIYQGWWLISSWLGYDRWGLCLFLFLLLFSSCSGLNWLSGAYIIILYNWLLSIGSLLRIGTTNVSLFYTTRMTHFLY